jgi:ABC-2 type transport system permease protein
MEADQVHFFKISLKNSMVYRWSVLFSIAGSVLYIAICLMLWRFLYRNTPDMVSYMTKYTIISNIIGMFYAGGIAYRIGGKVSSGAFVTDLIRPINMFSMSWQMEFAEICTSFLLRGLPVILVYCPFLIMNAGYYNIFAVMLAVILGHVLFMLIYALLGFSAFILIEIWPFGRLLDDTIRLLAGGFIPLAVLPGFLRAIAYALPFKFLYSFPLELLFNSADMSKLFENFALLIVWIFVFAMLNIVMYRLALKKAVVQGG